MPITQETTIQIRGLQSVRRIENFSDAVMAIVLTLLVFELRTPLPPVFPLGGLFELLLLISRYLAAFLISFVIIGLFWIYHHKIFSYIVRSSQGLIWLSLLFLLFLALTPFTTLVAQLYIPDPFAMTLNSIIVVIAGCLLLATWIHASRNHHLITKTLSKRDIRFITYRGLVIPTMTLIAIPFHFFLLTYGMIILLAIPVVYAIVAWRLRHVEYAPPTLES